MVALTETQEKALTQLFVAAVEEVWETLTPVQRLAASMGAWDEHILPKWPGLDPAEVKAVLAEVHNPHLEALT